jgi:2-keto-4-pentenoate hydratase
MTGSVSAVLRPKAGDTVRARFTRLGTVAARFV